MEIEEFFKNTITGILLLSCFASIMSVALLKLGKTFLYNVFPRYRNKIKSIPRLRAYKQGYSTSYINNDDSGRFATSYFFYHMSLLVLWSIFVAFCFSVFAIIALSRELVEIDIWIFIFPFLGFSSSYKAFESYEYIYRMYLSSWGKAMKHAEKTFYEAYPDGVNKVENSSNKKIKSD
ncbi:hypothetical protein [Thalassotalea montiporae]